MPARSRSLIVGGLTAAMLSLSALTAQAAAPTVLTKGHVDVLDAEYVSGALELHVHDESVVPDVEYDPSQVVLQALPASQTTVPSDSQYGFLGNPGEPVWVLPQNQNPDLLWPGISTEHVPSGVFKNNQVTFKLIGAGSANPNGFSVYKVSSLGAVSKYFDSEDGFTSDSRTMTIGAEDHANWAFEAVGDYSLTFELTATLTNGQTVSSGPVVYSFHVGA